MATEEKKEKKSKSASAPAVVILKWGTSQNIESCFDRADKMKPCPIGHVGACCKMCHMGPCRLVGKNAEEEMRGICGATLATIAARNITRFAAAGTAAHGDHGRDMAFTLLAVAEGHTKDFKVKDVKNLYRVAGVGGRVRERVFRGAPRSGATKKGGNYALTP